MTSPDSWKARRRLSVRSSVITSSNTWHKISIEKNEGSRIGCGNLFLCETSGICHPQMVVGQLSLSEAEKFMRIGKASWMKRRFGAKCLRFNGGSIRMKKSNVFKFSSRIELFYEARINGCHVDETDTHFIVVKGKLTVHIV